MKFRVLSSALIFSTLLTVAQNASANALTDEMALEEGMTPLEEIKNDAGSDFFMDSTLNMLDQGLIEFNRPEYVTTIPSMDDIDRVIRSHRQVIVINKAAKGPDAQTLRVYLNGQLRTLKDEVTKVVNGKQITEIVDKEVVKISTGRERQETAKSGRVYVSTTPKGFFRPQRLYTMYYSNTWKADMPNAIFMCSNFATECGIAIHATGVSAYPDLGTRASGGCVRTKLGVSEQLRELVMDTGRGSRPGQFSTVTESYRRFKVTNNTVSVDNVDRNTGVIGSKVNSWDTVIVVYE
jgi:lipoprotein-anchoring transpeptidase ErfK/SrfK